MDDIKISVIIPSFNAVATLKRAISSVLTQDYLNYEIIVIDDGSTDNTRQLMINEYSNHENIRFFCQSNRGPGAARNFGLEMAQGEFVAFLDADDEMCPGSLSCRVSFLEHTIQIGLVFSNYYVSKPDCGSLLLRLVDAEFLDDFYAVDEKNGNFISKETFFNNYLFYVPNPIYTCSVMVRKRIFEETGGFREDLFRSEDIDMWMRIMQKSSVGFINSPTVIYRSSPGSLSANKKAQKVDGIKYLTELLHDDSYKKYRKKLMIKISSDYYELAKLYYKDNKFVDMQNNSWLCLKYNCFFYKAWFLVLFSYLIVLFRKK